MEEKINFTSEPKQLLAKKHVDTEAECLLRHVKCETERFRPHFHDYFEIFLTLKGSADHVVNGSSFPVSRGYLIFVRDSDVHDYLSRSEGFELINLAFTRETLNALSEYLGDGMDFGALLNAKYPPSVRLTEKETDRLHMKLTELNAVNFDDKQKLKLRMRALLVSVFTGYFCDLRPLDSKIPLWLENSYEKMKLPKNFIVGKDRFFELCGRTREHCTRSLVKHYGVTPSAYVNELRLCYAANLLRLSNLSVADICYESGFGNLSWFYSEFEKKFGLSPKIYRQKKSED